MTDTVDSFRGRHLVLVGLMGAGKTTVGQRCAERLDRPFVDTEGRTVDEVATRVVEEFRSWNG